MTVKWTRHWLIHYHLRCLWQLCVTTQCTLWRTWSATQEEVVCLSASWGACKPSDSFKRGVSVGIAVPAAGDTLWRLNLANGQLCEFPGAWMALDPSGRGHSWHLVTGVGVSSNILQSSPSVPSVPADILRLLSLFSLLRFLRASREQFPSLLE